LLFVLFYKITKTADAIVMYGEHWKYIFNAIFMQNPVTAHTPITVYDNFQEKMVTVPLVDYFNSTAATNDIFEPIVTARHFRLFTEVFHPLVTDAFAKELDLELKSAYTRYFKAFNHRLCQESLNDKFYVILFNILNSTATLVGVVMMLMSIGLNFVAK